VEIAHRQIGRHIVLAGKAAHSDVPDARAVLMAGLDCGSGDLVVEVADLTITDLTVLGLLLEVHRRAERTGRRLVLVDVPQPMSRLLLRTKLSRVLTCTARPEEQRV
jgi:anti-anti-sigma factor